MNLSNQNNSFFKLSSGYIINVTTISYITPDRWIHYVTNGKTEHIDYTDYVRLCEFMGVDPY